MLGPKIKVFDNLFRFPIVGIMFDILQCRRILVMSIRYHCKIVFYIVVLCLGHVRENFNYVFLKTS